MAELPLPSLLLAAAARTAIVLICLVVGIRLFGKRGMGNMNLLDLLLVLLLGNAVQNALTFGSGHIGVGIVSAGVLLLMDRLVGFVFARNPIIEQRMFGGPTVLYIHDHYEARAMQAEEVDEDEVIAAVHAIGLENMAQVRLAVLEEDGTISIIPKEENG